MLATALAAPARGRAGGAGQAAAAAVRRAGRAGEVRHAASCPRTATPVSARASASASSSCRRGASRAARGRLHLPRGRAGRRRRERHDRRRGEHLEPRPRAPRHPARRPAGHRRLAPARVLAEPEPIDDVGADDQRLPRDARTATRRSTGRAAAADDLEAVRAALGYRRLDVYGGLVRRDARADLSRAASALGADRRRSTAATLLDVPFFERFAANGQRALDQVAAPLRRRPGLRARVPGLAGAAPLADRGLERAAGRDHARS